MMNLERLKRYSARTLNLNRFFLSFSFYSFLGWTVETISLLVTEHHFVVRGWFYFGLPMIPLYGFMCPLIIKLLAPRKRKPMTVFAASVFIATAAEYAIGLWLLKQFGIRYWDYSGYPLNLNGIIALPISLGWGVLSMVMIYWIDPNFRKASGRIPPLQTALLSWAVMAYVAFCASIDAFNLLSQFFR
jgi:uncharacterized membrane protein